jgi:hypothetical protein
MDLIFDIPRLRDFIDRTETLRPFNKACMVFSDREIKITLGSSTHFEFAIKCERPDWQLSSITEIFSQQLLLLSHVEQLEIRASRQDPAHTWNGDPDTDSSQWLELFYSFITVHSLHISKGLVAPIASALQDLPSGMAIEVLPALRNLSLEALEPFGSVRKSIDSFNAARLRSSAHPIVIHDDMASHKVGTNRTPFVTGVCPFPNCGLSFDRPQDLAHHVHQHLPHHIYCPQPGCKWTRSQQYALRTHFKTKHPSLPIPGRERYILYDANVVVKQLVNGEITAEQVERRTNLSFRRRAVETGKMAI